MVQAKDFENLLLGWEAAFLLILPYLFGSFLGGGCGVGVQLVHVLVGQQKRLFKLVAIWLLRQRERLVAQLTEFSSADAIL